MKPQNVFTAISIVALLVLSSCSVVAVNINRDARVLDPGKVQIRPGLGIGLDYTGEALSAAVNDSDDYDFYELSDFPVLSAFGRIYMMCGLRVGLFPHTDLTQNIWLPLKSSAVAAGGRTSLAVNLTRKASRFQFALLPSVVCYYSSGDSNSIDNVHLVGGEIPLLFSVDAGRFASPYTAISYGRNYVFFRDYIPLELDEEIIVQRFSLHGGAVIRIKSFSISPELAFNKIIAAAGNYDSKLSLGIVFGFIF
jgi:hypothetical protein